MSIHSKAYRAVVTMAAGLVASNLVALIWRMAMKDKPPKDTEDLELATTTAIAAAGLAGAATAVAHTLAGRHARRHAERQAAKTLAASELR